MADERAPKQSHVVVRVLRGFFRALRHYFTFVGALVTLGPLLAALIVARLGVHKTDFAATKAAPATLALGLSGRLEQSEPGLADRIKRSLFGGEDVTYLPSVGAGLRRAADDERIAGLELEIGALSGTPAEFAELRRLLEMFRSKGKTVRAVLASGDDWHYYLASAADRVVLNPASPVTITGPVYQLVYLGEALRKLGVGIDVVRAGKYKSAFEPLVADEPSAPTLEEYQAMNASILGHIVEVVAKSRGKSPDEVRQWYAESIFTAEQALARGLVDELGYPQGGQPTSLADYTAATDDAAPKPLADAVAEAGIGLIVATGEISLSEAGAASSEGISPLAMRKQIRWALGEDKVKAVVLRVASPGGSAIASDMIWNDLQELAASKPLIVSMGAYAASGGYYISAPARRIVAEPTTITGSIGVIGMLPSFEAFKEKYGVSFHVVTESRRRSMLNPGTRATPDDTALIEATIDQVYGTFLAKVAQGRRLPLEKVRELAQGRVYTGLEAKALGLVDEIGGMQQAFDAAKAAAGLDVKRLYRIHRYRDDAFDLDECLSGLPGFLRCLRSGSSGVAADWPALWPATAPLAGDAVATAAARAARWLEASRRERALALWPAWTAVSLR